MPKIEKINEKEFRVSWGLVNQAGNFGGNSEVPRYTNAGNSIFDNGKTYIIKSSRLESKNLTNTLSFRVLVEVYKQRGNRARWLVEIL